MGDGLFTMILVVISYLALVSVAIPLELSHVKRHPKFKKIINKLYWSYTFFLVFFFIISLFFSIPTTITIIFLSLATILLSILLIYVSLLAY